MKKLSLQKQILLPFLAVILLSSVILSVGGYRFAASITADTMADHVLETVELANRHYENVFRKIETLAEELLHQTDLADYVHTPEQETALLNTFAGFQAANADLLNIYFGTKNGDMILYPRQTLPDDYDPRTRIWYEEAVRSPDKPVWTGPYANATDGEPIISASKAVFRGEEVIGVVSFDIAIDELVEFIQHIRIGEEGYAVIFDRTGKFLYHPDPELSGQDVTQEEYYIKMKAAGDRGTITYRFQGEEKMFSFTTNPTTGWQIAGTAYVKEFEEAASALLLPQLLVTVAVVSAAVLVSILFAGRIVKPIRQLMHAMKEVENGNLTVQATLDRRDEIGQLSASFNRMIQRLRNIASASSRIAEQVAGASQTLAANAEQNQSSNDEIAKAMQQIAEASAQQAEAIERSANAMQRYAGNMQTVEMQSMAMDDASLHMLEISRSGVERVTELRNQSNHAVRSMNDMAEAVQALSERSGRIGNIIGTVADIAEQTNLLALNATIEAARAGEVGRGFTVVADEVRKLSDQTKQALKEIAAAIHDVQTETGRTVHLLQEAKQAMEQQDHSVSAAEKSFRTIMMAVETNTTLIRQISESLQQAAEEKREILSALETANSVTQETAAGAEEVSASVTQQYDAARQIAGLAEELEKLAAQLTDEMRQFQTK